MNGTILGGKDISALAMSSLQFFLFTMLELAVLFIGISFLVGVIHAFLPPEKVQGLLSGRRGKGYVVGAALGSVTPFCSCSTIPVTAGFLRAGAGFGPTMTFLFTSPLVNPIIIPLLFTLLGLEITVIYSLSAVSMAMVAGFLLQRSGFERYVRPGFLHPGAKGNVEECTAPSCAEGKPCCNAGSGQVQAGLSFLPLQKAKKQSRWRLVLDDTVGQYRRMFPFILIGVAIGALIHGFLPAQLLAGLAGPQNPLAVPVSAIIGIPLYLRASTMVPIGASLVAKGMSLGAVIALIIGGAGASLPELAMLKGMFRNRLLLSFITSILLIAVVTGYLVNRVV